MKNSHFGLFFAIFMLSVLLLIGYCYEKNTESSYDTYARYSGSRSSSGGSGWPSKNERPPVNREKALSKEAAERLYGTGYGGCRPNTSAEISAIKAAMTTCKNCGYHTDNGLNSLCDYCMWMSQYGGGLPAQETTERTTASTRSSRTSSKSDPYDAADYYDADDFYFDYYDDFWDYEDAEDYWEDYDD